MTYLLDTHTFIWSFLDTHKLSKGVLEILEDSKNTIYVNTISFWELAIKEQLGKISFNNIDIRHFPNIVEQLGFQIQTNSAYDFVTYKELPHFAEHKDPFDKMLIHTAIRNNLILLSKDSQFEQYKEFGLQIFW